MPDKNYFSSNFTLGILGGGQLGKMLLTETRRYDIRTRVMDPSADAPGRLACNEFVQNSLNDEEAVYEFGKDCDVITIEIENVSVEGLKRLQQVGKKVFPKPEVLEIIQDKCRQKEFYREKRIPTSPFHTFKNLEELNSILKQHEIHFPFVWKAARGGYDGRGVQVVKNPEDLDKLSDVPGLIEELIHFEKELAVIVARSPSGEIKCYPVVEMDFHPTANLVEYVFCPSQIGEDLKAKAEMLAVDAVEKLDHIGLLAVEMFLSTEGDILVNEVAPRVHNSGHLSIEGNVCSQFEQHLRAILDLPLGATDITRPSVMLNLTGEEGFQGPVYYEGIEEILGKPGVYVHLYGKSETRPFRKMGHITVCADKLSEARQLASEIKEIIKVKSHS